MCRGLSLREPQPPMSHLLHNKNNICMNMSVLGEPGGQLTDVDLVPVCS